MRIVLLAASSSVHVLRWANAMAERGHEVHLVSQHVPIPGFHEGIRTHRLPFSGVAGYLLNGPSFQTLLRRIRPDVVNAHYATGYGTLARWTGPFPLVINVWGSDVFEFPDQGPLHKSWLLGNLRRAGVEDVIERAIVAWGEPHRQHWCSVVGHFTDENPCSLHEV